MKKFIISLPIIIAACAVIIYIISTINKQPADTYSKKLKVAATIFPLYDITRNIAGDKAEVIQIMNANSSVHTFEPSAELIKKLADTSLVFYVGNGLDDWTVGLQNDLNKKTKLVTPSENIQFRLFPDKSIDPHYWLSLKNAETIALNITKQLIELDPANTNYYQENAQIYLNKLALAEDEIKIEMDKLASKRIAIFHEAWYYFADEYDLNIVATFEEFPGKEPTPGYLAEFVNSVRKNNIKTIFSEPQFSSEAIKQIAKDENLHIDSLNPMDGGGLVEDSYIAIMKKNAEKISDALKNK